MSTWRRIAIAAGAILFLATGTQAIAAGRPVAVVELFTSQGCSSCPSANANLIKLSGAADADAPYGDAMIAAALTAPRSATTKQKGGRR
jgi:hypothetical protein